MITIEVKEGYKLSGATAGAEGTFYYLLVEEGDPSKNYEAAGEIRDAVLYMGSLTDGSTINSIVINERNGKLYEDDDSYGANYKPVGSCILRYSAAQDMVAILAEREQIDPELPDGDVFQTSVFSMFDSDLSQQQSSGYGSDV